jgi:hypothetical protein
MMTKRVFSHNNEMNFNDYNSIKKGLQIIKNKKSQDMNLNYFFSYHEFLILTKVFFKYTYTNDIIERIPLNILNGTEGSENFDSYNKILIHLNNCEDCKKSKNVVEISNCQEIKNILYPLGKYFSLKKDTIYFPSKLDLNEWCIKPKSEIYINNNEIKPLKKKVECCCKNSFCKYGLCKNAKPLF